MRPDLPALGYQLHSAALRYRLNAGEGWPRSGSAGARDSMVLATPAAKAKMTPTTPGPLSRHWRMARLETVLFLAREPLSSRKLSHLANLADGTEARTLIRGLNRFFDQSGTAFRVEEVAGGFQLFSRPQFSDWLRRIHGTTYEIRLSAPAMETLAVVAYRQPVVRARIESIRGVQCGEILRQLMERDLVRITGRSHELGRPFLYGTTRRFLQIFGLRHLEDLPRAELFNMPAANAAITGEPAEPIDREKDEEKNVSTADSPDEKYDDEDDYEGYDFEDDDEDDDVDDDVDKEIEDTEWEEVKDDDEWEDDDDDDDDEEDDEDWDDEDWEDDQEDEEEDEGKGDKSAK